MNIIEGDAKTAEECIKIARALPDYFTDSGITNLVHDLKRHQIVAVEEFGGVFGFAIVASNYPQSAELLWLAIQKEHQRKGYGAALINHLTIELKKQGTKLLAVKTLSPIANYPPYEPTRHFYEKNGFILIDIIDPYPGWEPGNPCALYAKIL